MIVVKDRQRVSRDGEADRSASGRVVQPEKGLGDCDTLGLTRLPCLEDGGKRGLPVDRVDKGCSTPAALATLSYKQGSGAAR